MGGGSEGEMSDSFVAPRETSRVISIEITITCYHQRFFFRTLIGLLWLWSNILSKVRYEYESITWDLWFSAFFKSLRGCPMIGRDLLKYRTRAAPSALRGP